MKKLSFFFVLIITLSSFQTDNLVVENSDKVILIGVTRYNHTLSWKYTDDDAYRFYAFYKSILAIDKNISILIDEDATNKNIIDKITTDVLNCDENNNFFLYFGGHTDSTGIWGIDGIPNNVVKYEELGKILKKSNAKHNLLIINGAYSKIAEKAFGNNITVWFAGKEAEKTPETNSLRQTIFGHFLIQGLKGKADIDENKIVTLEELKNYVYDNVRHYTTDKQNPKMINFAPTQWVIR